MSELVGTDRAYTTSRRWGQIGGLYQVRGKLLVAALAVCGAHGAFGAPVSCSPSSNDALVVGPTVELTIGGFNCSAVLVSTGQKPVVFSLPGVAPGNAITETGVFTLNSFTVTVNPDPY